MGRKILFITTDQQRYDALGCNGNEIARTPAVDRLAANGINFNRAYTQNTLCMPARSTMLTGQYARTHGVFTNGVPLPADAPSVARYLADEAGYRTALIGKAHFEPVFDLLLTYPENALAHQGSTGPLRGFEHLELSSHSPVVGGQGVQHYGVWLLDQHPEYVGGFAQVLAGIGGGETGAPDTAVNPIPRDLYHTDWVADRTIAFLDSLNADDDWFVWMSFPDPHHPWDPPAAERKRVPWQELDLPSGHPGSPEAIRAVLSEKPAHWLAWYEDQWRNVEGGPARFCPGTLTDDQIREVDSLIHVENELVDEACGRVLNAIQQRGWREETDVFYTSDHGELQGDYGLLFKGPFHTDALMRVPFIWQPAPVADITPAEIDEPVGHLDLAPTFCEIAGVPVAPWIQGSALPTSPGSGRERALCEWDSKFPGYGMHMRSIYRDDWLCTAYEASTKGVPTGIEDFIKLLPPENARRFGLDEGGPQSSVVYDGTEGELYDVEEDPHQFRNLWNDPAHRSIRDDLVADLYDHLPAARDPSLRVERPA